MAERHFRSPQARMLNGSANLTSMFNDGFVELAWEDGRTLTKPHPRVIQKTPSSLSSSNHSDSPRESTEGNRFNKYTERLETVNFNSFYGSKDLPQADNSRKNMEPILGYSNNLPQEVHSQWFHNGLSSFSVNNKSRIYDKNHLIGTYGMPVIGSTYPGLWNRSSVILKEATENTTRRMSSNQEGHTPVSFLTSGPSPSITPYPGDGLSSPEILKESEARNMNFSYFFRQRSRFARPGSSKNFPTIEMENKKSSFAAECKTTLDMSAIPSSRCSDKQTGFQEKHDVVSNRKMKPTYVNNFQEQAVPDEQSEVAGLLDSLRTEKTNDQALHPFSGEGATAEEKTANNHEQPAEVPVASSSICSRGASNNPACRLKGRYEESETAYASEYDTEETDDVAIATVPVKETVGTKRKRSAVHSLSERKRRDRINKKMRALQELLPNCNKKVDKASVLDEAIDYLKTLQLQLQIMSTGTRFFMPPMMLPAGMQQLHTPHMNQLPAMGIGMGMRMDSGVGPGTSQLPTASIPGGTLLLGNGGGGFQMLGFQPMPGLPFLPFFGQPSMPVVAPGTSTFTSTNPYQASDLPPSSNEAEQET